MAGGNPVENIVNLDASSVQMRDYPSMLRAELKEGLADVGIPPGLQIVALCLLRFVVL